MPAKINDNSKAVKQGILLKYQTLVAAAITCIVPFFIWSFNHYDDKDNNTSKAETEVLGVFEQAKNALDKDIGVCSDGGRLSKQQIAARIARREAYVTEIMKVSKYIPSDALFHFAIFSRFDDTPKYKKLCTLQHHDLVKLENKISALQREIRNDLS